MFEPEYKDDVNIDIKKALAKRSERKKIYSELVYLDYRRCDLYRALCLERLIPDKFSLCDIPLDVHHWAS